MSNEGGLLPLRQTNACGRYLAIDKDRVLKESLGHFSTDGCCLFLKAGEVMKLEKASTSGKSLIDQGVLVTPAAVPRMDVKPHAHYRLLVEVNPTLYELGPCIFQHIIEPGEGDTPLQLRIPTPGLDIEMIKNLPYIFKCYLFM